MKKMRIETYKNLKMLLSLGDSVTATDLEAHTGKCHAVCFKLLDRLLEHGMLEAEYRHDYVDATHRAHVKRKPSNGETYTAKGYEAVALRRVKAFRVSPEAHARMRQYEAKHLRPVFVPRNVANSVFQWGQV